MRTSIPTSIPKIKSLVFLLILCAGNLWSQEPAPTVRGEKETATPMAHGNGLASASASNPAEDPAPPSVPGAQVVVLPEGKNPPERMQTGYEDWGSPELPSGMKTEVVPLAKSMHNGFSRQLVSVQWRELDPIDLWIIKPTGVKNPPVILYLYSFPSNNDRYQDLNFCKFLTSNGFAAVGFVSAINGQRFHDRPQRDTFINQLKEGLSTSAHDVQLIISYLATRGDMDMDRVGIWGDGSGASIAILAAAVDPRIKAVDLLDPWGDWPEWLAKSSLVSAPQRADLLKPEYLKLVENLDPANWLPKLKTQNVRLQYIKEGLNVTSATVMERMEAAAPSNVQIVHYQDPKTFYANVGSRGTGFDWIKAQLAPSSQVNANVDHMMTKSSVEQKKSEP